MKKITFETKDGYEYTITEMTDIETINAIKIFKMQGKYKKLVTCMGHQPIINCHQCPLAEPCEKGDNIFRVIKSSIKIEY